MQNPDRKVTVGALGGAFGVLLVYTAQYAMGAPIPAEVGMAAQTIIIFGLQWLIPNQAPKS